MGRARHASETRTGTHPGLAQSSPSADPRGLDPTSKVAQLWPAVNRRAFVAAGKLDSTPTPPPFQIHTPYFSKGESAGQGKRISSVLSDRNSIEWGEWLVFLCMQDVLQQILTIARVPGYRVGLGYLHFSNKRQAV